MEAAFDRAEVSLREVEVRPARADERRRWDALMAAHHYPGFRQFTGRGLRHVAVSSRRWPINSPLTWWFLHPSRRQRFRLL